MPKGEKNLRECLEGDLKIQIENIWRKAKEYLSKQDGDCIQDIKHCETVEENLGRLIPDDKKEGKSKQINMFILSAAACLHDIGKIKSHTKVQEKDHGEQSKKIILENYESLGLDRGQALAVADIAGVHNHGRLNELPKKVRDIGSDEVNIIELAAIFRLADMIDTTYSRAPDILSKIKFPNGNISSKIRARGSITGWHLDEKNRIILQAAPEKDSVDAVNITWGMMKEEISKITDYLKDYGYPYEFGELDRDESFSKPEVEKEVAQKRPFPGMAPYTRKHKRIFKGRTDEINDLANIVETESITMLIGESGAGKTSLIYAGLFPELEYRSWKCICTRPSGDSIENIKEYIWSNFFKWKVNDEKSLLDVLRSATKECNSNKLLIVIDQFEDVLNFTSQKALDDLILALKFAYSKPGIPNLRILLSFRVDALIKLNNKLLKEITGSAQQFFNFYLDMLTREGAKKAFLAGLGNAEITFDPVQEEGEKSLIEVILDDIQKDDEFLYPPYFQKVAETLCRKVVRDYPFITRKMYSELGGADKIIADYLIELLKEFESQKEKAEKVLISLTSSVGEKVKKTLYELSQETDTDIGELEEILKKMVDLRIVQRVDDSKFEIIHDHLRRIVNEKLMGEEDRKIKFLEEQLNLFHLNYEEYRKEYGDPITLLPVWGNLYKYRRQIRIDEKKYSFILCVALWEEIGLGWYWLRELDTGDMLELTKVHIHHKREDIRDQARTLFVKIITSENIDIIIKMLDDEENFVRKAAVEALGKIAIHEDLETILKVLNDNYEDVRKAAEEIFVKVVTHEDRDTILKMLDDKEQSVRKAAVEALGKIATFKDRDTILKMLDDKEQSVRKAAVEALGKIALHEDINKIGEILNSKNVDIRKAAEKVFVEIAAHEDMDTIIKKLDSKYEDVRDAARQAFVRIVTSEDKSRIIRMLHDESLNEKWPVKKATVEALGKIATHEDRDELIEMLSNNYGDVRRAAGEIFIKIAIHEDMDTIIKMLSTEEKHIRMIVEQAFVKIATFKDRDTILKMLDDEESFIRKAAVEALGKIATFKDRDTILKMLDDKEYSVQKVAAEVLKKIVAHEDIDKIIKLLDSGDGGVRRAAEEIFVEIATHEDIDKIIKLLDSSHVDVRRAAEEIFVEIATHEDRKEILEKLHSSHVDVRRAAVDALGKIATFKDRSIIIKMLNDKEQSVREAAAETLKKIAIHKDIDIAIEMLHNNYEDVREASVKALGEIVTDEKREYILDSLSDKASNLLEEQRKRFFKILTELDRIYYCP